MRNSALSERQRIVELAQAGHSDAAIAATTGWSVAAVRKWRRRGLSAGPAGLLSHLGRPVGGALSQFPAAMRQALHEWRTAHPGWGPATLHAELARDDRFAAQRLPSRASLARWLRVEHFVAPRWPRQAQATPALSRASAAHEVWELDARGYERVEAVGMISLINLADRFSRVKLLSYPCFLGRERVTRYANCADYQMALRLAFLRWGLPDALAVDHDGIYYDNTCPTPFPTALCLWLAGLGVELRFSRPGRPTDHGMIERSHQTWAQQVLVGQRFGDWDALYDALQQRLAFLNEHLPCRTTDDQPPLVACPAARQPRRPYDLAAEPALFSLARVDALLRQGEWARQVDSQGGVRLGGQRYWLGPPWAKHPVLITLQPDDRRLLFRDRLVDQTRTWPIKGLEAADLMGDFARILTLQPLQLPLPLAPADQQVIRLCETLGDTS